MFHRRDDPKAAPETLRFGPFVLNLHLGTLLRDGQPVPVPRRPFELLCYLARHAGRVVPADELLDAVWGHQHLSASSLKATVNNLRRALGEDGKSARWIASIPRRGYRFVADEAVADGLAAAPGLGTTGDAASRGPSFHASTGAPALAPTHASANSGADTAAEHPELSAPIGRAAEFAQLQSLLATQRLVTLSGSAGIGKTHLALAALPLLASRCADGAWLLRLDSVSDADTLVTQLAHTLRLAPDAGRDADALADALRTLSAGLLLDNCEHLAGVLPPLVARLMEATPGLHVLCTSQQPLGLAGEALLALGPLSLPLADKDIAASTPGAGLDASGAASLLLARLRQREPNFQADAAQARHIAAICRALDGVPLELELAAARVPLLGLAGVQARLHERLDMLRQHTPSAEASNRHHSLRAALGWSHALLPPLHQQVLHGLSVFEGSFSATAAEAVLTDEKLGRWDVLDAIAALAERSLLAPAGTAPVADSQRRRDDDAELAGPAAQQPRWRLLHGIRAFAAEQLAKSGDSAQLQQRHARWMQQLLAEAAPQLHEMASQDWLARLEPELDNLRAALRHAQRSDPQQALQLWSHSVAFWVRAGLKHEALRWQRALKATPAELALEASSNLPGTLQADLAQAHAVLCVHGMAVPPQEARQAAELAHRLHADSGNVMAAYYDIYLLAMILVRLQQPLPESGLLARMQAMELAGWNRAQRRYARWIAAVQQRGTGDIDGYLQAMREEQAFARQLGDRSTFWSASYALAMADHERGDVPQAINQLGQVWDDMATAGALRSQPATVGIHAAMLLWHGPQTAASPRVQQAVALLRADRSLWTLASALPWRALWDGRPADAARLLGYADAQIAAVGERRGPFFKRLNTALESALREALDADQEARLREEGARLDEAAALLLVFGSGSVPIP